MITTASRKRNTLIVTNVLLAAVGAILLVLYRTGLHAQGVADIVWFIKLALVQSALYLVAAWLIVRARNARSTLIIVLVLAGIFAELHDLQLANLISDCLAGRRGEEDGPACDHRHGGTGPVRRAGRHAAAG